MGIISGGNVISGGIVLDGAIPRGSGQSGNTTDLLVLFEPGSTTTQTTTSATTSLRAGGGAGSVKVSWQGGSVTLVPGAAATTVSIPSGTAVTFDALSLTTGPC